MLLAVAIGHAPTVNTRFGVAVRSWMRLHGEEGWVAVVTEENRYLRAIISQS